jgi:small subunit ribosomal protein S20
MADDKKKKAKTKVPTAVKREIQSEKRKLLNKAFRSKVNTVIKALTTAGADLAPKMSAVYSMMDKGVKKGVFTQNKASRFKSRITRRFAAKA